MSEPETEPQTEPTEPETEPEVPFEEPEPETGPETHAPDEPAAPAMDARDDREIDAIYTRLETRAKNYVKSVSEILEGHGVPVHVCEMCLDSYPGLRWTEPRDEMHAQLVSVVAEVEQGAPLKDDPNAEVCHACDGFGIVKLPSHVPENQMRMCRACNGAGYRELNPQSGTAEAPAPPAANGELEPMVGVPVDDPVLADYMARGYTVIPPMKFAGDAN